MSEQQIQEIEKKLIRIEAQIGRLVSNAESEKEVRKDRNAEIDKRLRMLEDDKIVRDTTIKNVGILWGVIGTILGIAISIIANHFIK